MLTTGDLEGASWIKGATCAKALGKQENMVSLRDSKKTSKLGVDETRALKCQWR